MKAIDLFCKAGGASMGLHRAGFDVTGVDIEPQPRYPFTFVQDDALEFPWDRCWYCDATGNFYRHGEDGDYLPCDECGGMFATKDFHYDFIWASPVCKRYTRMTNCRPGKASEHPDDIATIRGRLEACGKPWVIENVPGAPLRNPIMLCGLMFGLELHRHRLFEASFHIEQPVHPKHTKKASRAGHWTPGTVMSVCGNFSPVEHAREIMGIDWMTRDELAQAIPPAYSQYIAERFLSSDSPEQTEHLGSGPIPSGLSSESER